MGAANNINKSYPAVLRAAGTHQTDSGLLWAPPSLRVFSPPGADGKTTSMIYREGIWVRSFELHNRSGGAANVGIGGRLANRWWRAGRLSADGTTYTDVTSTAQTSVSGTTLEVAGANQTGFVLLSLVPFDWASVNITTAETDNDSGGEINHAVYYSTGATWTALGAGSTYTDGFTTTGTPWAAAATNLVIQKPADWTPTAGNGGVPDGYYGLRFTVEGREASDVAAVATGIEIGQMLVLEALADNGIWEIEVIDFWMPQCESLVAYFDFNGSGNAGNRVYAEVLTR